MAQPEFEKPRVGPMTASLTSNFTSILLNDTFNIGCAQLQSNRRYLGDRCQIDVGAFLICFANDPVAAAAFGGVKSGIGAGDQ